MQALLLEKENKFIFYDLPVDFEENKIHIKVKAMGICGSDISAFRGTLPIGTLPRVLGHEVAGEVIHVPKDNTTFKIGDRVVVEPYQYCRTCYPCSLGRTNCCENMRVMGVHENGGFAEYINYEAHLIHKVPSNVTWEQIVMVEPLTIAMNGVERIHIKKGEHVVITGAGTIGLLAALYVMHLGSTPIVVDPVLQRLELAKSMGVPYVFDPINEDVVEEINIITNGKMVDAAVEASGAPSAIKSTIDYVAYTGRIVLVGYPKDEVLLPTYNITKKEISLNGARNCVKAFPKAITLISEKLINVEPIITKVIDFKELPEYFKIISENPADYLKVIAKIN